MHYWAIRSFRFTRIWFSLRSWTDEKIETWKWKKIRSRF